MKETGLTGKRRSTTIAATPDDGKSQRKRRRRSIDNISNMFSNRTSLNGSNLLRTLFTLMCAILKLFLLLIKVKLLHLFKNTVIVQPLFIIPYM